MKEWMDRVSNRFKTAMMEGLVCYAQNKGNEALFVRVDHWLPHLEHISEEKAKQILFCKYLTAYGPATVQDFSKWSGIKIIESKNVFNSIRDELWEVNCEGRKGYILSGDLKVLASVKLKNDSLQLLPSFDSYILGHAKKDLLIDIKNYKKVYRSQWWISPVILLGGRIIGVWSHRKKSKSYLIEVELFDKFSKTVIKKIEKEIKRLEKFWESTCSIKFCDSDKLKQR
jgi:uncharacterized protein YcaQ